MTTPAPLELSPKAKVLNEVHGKLQELLQKNMEALPKGFNQTRFLQNCLTVLNDTKEIEKCTPMSVARTMIKGAYLGLDFFRRECYAIPYGTELNFQTDYKGEIKLVKKYSQQPILDVYAQLVRDGDELDINIDAGKQSLNFKPKLFNDGEIIGAFAVVYFADTSMRYEAMSKKEIEDIRRKFSKAPNSPAWDKSYGEMCKKVVLRRLCKMLALDFDHAEQDKAFEEGAETIVHKGKKIVDVNISDPFGKEDAPKAAADSKSTEQAKTPKPPFDEEKYRKELKEKHPNYDDSYIDHLVKEEKTKCP